MYSDDIYLKYSALRDQVYGDAHSRMRMWDDLYEGIVACHQPSGEPVHIPPTGLVEINNGVGQLGASKTTYAIDPSDTAKDSESAERIRKAIDITFEESSLLNEKDIFSDFDRYLILRGMGVMYGPVFKYERYEQGLWPIIVAPVDPLNFFPDPAGRYAICAYERFAGEVAEQLNEWNGKKEVPTYSLSWVKEVEGDFKKVLWLEYWTPDSRCFMVVNGGKPFDIAEMQENKLGFIPFSWQYSGWGKGKASGDPKMMAIGRLYGMESSIEAEARNFTAYNVHLRYWIYGRMMVPDTFKEYLSQMPSNPGEPWVVAPEMMPNQPGGVSNMPQITINQDAFPYMAMAKRDIEAVGGPAAMRGLGPADESGVKAMTRIRQSNVGYKPPLIAKERVISQLSQRVCAVVKNDLFFEGSLNVSGKTKISASDINEHVMVKARLEFVDPLFDQEHTEIGLRLYQSGVISLRILIRDYLKIERNPMNVIAEILAERIMLNPAGALATALGNKALEKLGYWELAQGVEDILKTPSPGTNRETIRTDRNKEQRLEGAAGQAPTDTRYMEGVR